MKWEPASICVTRNDSLTIHLSDPTKFPFTSQQELLPNLAIGLTKDGAIAALEFQDASLALTCHFEPGTSCFKEGCLAPFALNGEYDESSDSLRISFEEASNFSEQPERTCDERIFAVLSNNLQLLPKHEDPGYVAPSKPSIAGSNGSTKKTQRVAVLGASGYTGEEVVRLLALHPSFKATALTGESQAGKSFAEVYPHLVTATDVPTLVKIADVDWDNVDAAFCCLPHATTQETLAQLPKHIKVVDLSADFRLRDVNQYAEWYGGEHKAKDLQKEAVYGLTEIYRDQVKGARLVANPGCYPTSVQLPLYPLLQSKLIEKDDIIIDAKSGVSGAGRSAKVNLLYTEIAEGINSYGITKHRHMPEIEQGLSEAAGSNVTISFTPHLMPMTRGMQSTCYVKLANGATVDQLRQKLQEKYADEPFVHILKAGQVPHTRYVRGSNYNHIGVFADRLPGRAIIISVLDNLVKGAAGQALQNLNVMMGVPEETGLLQQAMFP